MKSSRSHVRRTLAAALVIACVFAWAAPAYAALNDPPSGTSITNPNAGDAEWREGWGNSMRPEFTLSTPADTNGFLYMIRRTPTFPTTETADASVSWNPSGSLFSHDYDLQGIFESLSEAERLYQEQPGEWIHDKREGVWYLSMRFFNDTDLSSVSWPVAFGVDLTRPNPVIGFTSGVSRVTETTRRNYTWLNKEYDDLSHGYFYNLYVQYPDGTEKSRRFKILDWFPGKATIEDLKPGVNRVGLSVTDRATNEGEIVWHTDTVDPDVPGLSVQSPKAWAWLSGTQKFSAIATDLACNPKVTFKLDGVTKTTDGSVPYEYSVDTKKLSAGKHLLTTVATDLYGHTRTDNRYFQVDNSPIGISSISVSPNPFYPILHDGYKDTTTMHCYLSESASELSLQIFNAEGAVLREYKKTNVSAGNAYIGWDGKDNTGSLSTGTFWYRFVAKDRAGNRTTTGMSSVIIRDYEIVRVGPGEVRVVPR